MKLTRALTLAALGLAATLTWAQDDPEKPAPKGPEVGKPAPTLRLNDHLGRAATVGGKAEHWTVLAFYPKAMTPG